MTASAKTHTHFLLPFSRNIVCAAPAAQPKTKERVDWLPESHTTKSREPVDNVPEQQLPYRGAGESVLSTRKRVPGFSIGQPTNESLPKTSGHPERRKGKRGRSDCGGGGGQGDSTETRATRARELGETRACEQEHQHQRVREASSGGALPCRACRSEVKLLHL